MTEERIRELVDRSLEMIESEEQREKRMKTEEQSLRDLWDNIKGLTFVSPESQKDRRKRLVQEKKKIDEILAKNFPNWVKDINL